MTAKEILKKYFGYDNFRPMQEEVINAILEGKDILAIMPTGAGKSLCFQVPSLMLPHGSIVISPLISLMKDQVEGLNEQGIAASFVNSTITHEESIERLRDLYRGKIKLLYMAPEKLETSYFTHCLMQVPLSMIVIDEAHCVSQWGHDFRPGYLKIKNFINALPKKPQIAALTATATKTVEKDMCENLGLLNAKHFKTGLDRPNLSFSVISDTDKKQFIEKYLNTHKEESGIIYAATRKAVDEIYEEIKEKGYKVGKYHAGMDDEERKKVQDDFSFDHIQIMVATNAFGMGIDKSNIRYIIHYHMPKSIEAYYQEAGRSGRDGDEAECILLYSGKDSGIQKYLIQQGTGDQTQKNREYAKLHAMIDYCKTGLCLRNHILKYFGENPQDECKHCSTCKMQKIKTDVTETATLVFRTIKILNGHFGVSIITDILKGSRSKALKERKLEKTPTYGRLSFETTKHIKTAISRYIADGYIKREGEPYPTLKLTQKGEEVLERKRKVISIAPSATDALKDTLTQNKTTTTHKNENFEKLRKLRKNIADKEKVPPFVIFSDATLSDMLHKMPTNEKEMEKVKGVGAFKLQKYGKIFIEQIKKIKKTHKEKNEKEKITETDKEAFKLYMKKVLERIQKQNKNTKNICEINENLIKFLYTNEKIEKYLNDEQKKHKEEIHKALETYKKISEMEREKT